MPNFVQITNNVYGVSLMRLLVLILIRAILEQSINIKMVSEIKVQMSITNIYLL